MGFRREISADRISELTLAFWIDFSELDLDFDTRLFYVGNGNETYAYMSLDYEAYNKSITLKLFDGRFHESLTADVSPETGFGGWHHLVLTHDVVGASNRITIYIDGFTRATKSSDASLDNLTTNVIFFTDFVIDELYISNIALSSDNVLLLNAMELKDFFTYMGGEIKEVIPVVPDNPSDQPDEPDNPGTDNPYEPEEPEEPNEEEPGEEEGWKPPENIDRIKFSWLAYTFDSTYDISRDLNKTTSAIINEFAVTKIATASYNGSFAYGLTKRTGATPNQYLRLNPGLLYQADAFTFCAWVYRVADKEDPLYSYSPMKLLDFSGYGKFEFSPFKTSGIPSEIYDVIYPPEDEESVDSLTETVPLTEEAVKGLLSGISFTNSPVIEYGTDSEMTVSNQLNKTSLSNVNGKWVHYALSYSQSGEVKVYVNGTLTDTFYTGNPFSALQITEFRILSGSDSLDSSRYIIDEIYLAPRVVDASDIRRIRTYGIKRFTTEVLPDPSPQSSSSPTQQPVEITDLRPDDTDNLEDSYTERAEINGFVGTTFDDTSLIGKDINNSVIAVIRNASLSQGIKNYGLTLDGVNSYIRYPIGILDNATELTFSIAYNWSGNTSSVNQKLFYFARKENSVSKPTAYMLLDMGNGTDGLSFEIYDGSSKTTLHSSSSPTNEWVRATVTIKDGTARLYINGALVDHSSTNIYPALLSTNFNYVGKSGVKGEPLFKGVVDDIYISPSALSAQEIQNFESYGIEPYVPNENVEEKNEQNDDMWDKIINGVVIATGVLVFIIVIVIIVTIFKK